MIINIDDDTYINADAVTMIRRHDSNGDGAMFTVDVRGHRAPALMDSDDLARLIAASTPVVPGDGWNVLTHTYDTWGYPHLVAHPVIAWSIMPGGARPILAAPLRQKPTALLSRHGVVHLIKTGQTMSPYNYHHALLLDRARRDGRVLDAPAVEADPLSA